MYDKIIMETLEEAYKTRNLIVHGEDCENTNQLDSCDEDVFFLEDLVIEVEELLRKTIRALLNKTDCKDM